MQSLIKATTTRQHHPSIFTTLHIVPKPSLAPTAPRHRISHHCSNALPPPRSPPLPDHGQQQPLIASRRNPLMKQLRQLHTTRGRREAGGVLLEGTHLLEEALRHGLALQRLVFTQRWAENHPALLAQVPPGSTNSSVGWPRPCYPSCHGPGDPGSLWPWTTSRSG